MSLRVRRLRALAGRLRRLRCEEHFDQQIWMVRRPCGTAACVAGHALIMKGGPRIRKLLAGLRRNDPGDYFASDDARAAAEYLRLSHPEAEVLFTSSPQLFWPEPFGSRWHRSYKRWRPTYRDPSRRKSRIAADFLDAIADGLDIGEIYDPQLTSSVFAE